MINHLLIMILVVLSLFQPTSQRFAISFFFALFCLLHAVISTYLGDVLYYLTAGFFDMVVIGVICVLSTPTKFTDKMLGVCVASVLLNFYGLVLYHSYLPPTTYNFCFSILYITVAFVLLGRNKNEDNSGVMRFYLHNSERVNIYNPLYKEAKN